MDFEIEQQWLSDLTDRIRVYKEEDRISRIKLESGFIATLVRWLAPHLTHH